MKYIMKILMDLIYLSPLRINKFRKLYPNDSIEGYGACKGIKLDSEEDVSRGLNWALSTRGFLIFTDKRIVVDKWEIYIDDIEKAELMNYRSGMVLKLKMKSNEYYQFGLQYIKELLNQDCLELSIIDANVKYSLFSIVIRIFIVLYFAYLLIKLI